ncbi:AP2/B3-like transcriptional factor family protein [Striga asiatica]|uniref:AP2/B3-like transcriptional factor family protein n=1 Tax=Striga asiatica TaxID=4170 RepID=A0A5A7Q9Z5_STRAF|nr:AP2/B3-like transcriptional factor family protein [Striga asiatica]
MSLIMPALFKRFFIVVSNSGRPTMRLQPGLVHQYMLLVPLQCTLTTREGRTYRVTIRGNDEHAFCDEGWLDFPIPIQFLRSHVVGECEDLTRCLLIDDTQYEVEIVNRHGKSVDAKYAC